MIRAKLLLQDLWCQKIDWDTPLETETRAEWLHFRETLCNLPKIQVPRYLGVAEGDQWILHGFSDASQRAYAAAVYLALPGRHSLLIMAKSKVAPAKTISLPKLELCGAVMLVRLIKHLKDQFPLPPTSIHC